VLLLERGVPDSEYTTRRYTIFMIGIPAIEGRECQEGKWVLFIQDSQGRHL
jgi:hypothetical protein